jgi:hypothetical protein
VIHPEKIFYAPLKRSKKIALGIFFSFKNRFVNFSFDSDKSGDVRNEKQKKRKRENSFSNAGSMKTVKHIQTTSQQSQIPLSFTFRYTHVFLVISGKHFRSKKNSLKGLGMGAQQKHNTIYNILICENTLDYS